MFDLGSRSSRESDRSLKFIDEAGRRFWSTVLVLMTLTAGSARAEMTQASFYTRESAQREGTSGIWTASGERYNENAQTCAHPSFRFGTLLKVRNPKNGVWFECRVNDRGPAAHLVRKGRELDLTPKGFKLLGIPLKKGVVQVDVKEVRS